MAFTKRTIPQRATYRNAYAADFDAVYKALLALLKEENERPALADHKRGLINTQTVALNNASLRKLITSQDAERIKQEDGAISCRSGSSRRKEAKPKSASMP